MLGFAEKPYIFDFSVQPLCLYGELVNHRDTENTEVAQRNQYVETFSAKPFRLLFWTGKLKLEL